MTDKTEAIANADAHLSNVGLPTYSELLNALRAISRADFEVPRTVQGYGVPGRIGLAVAVIAGRDLIARAA